MSGAKLCNRCGKPIENEGYYFGPKKHSCSIFCSKILSGDRANLLSICAGPMLLFKGFMFSKILSGEKTQTRRLVSGTNPNNPPCKADEVRYLREPIREVDKWAYYVQSDPPAPVVDEHGYPVAWRWKIGSLSSMLMPKKCARYFVLVSDVRQELLCEITEEDAIAEGCRSRTVGDSEVVGTAVQDFERLWDGINVAGHFAMNPLVWVITFRLIAK